MKLEDEVRDLINLHKRRSIVRDVAFILSVLVAAGVGRDFGGGIGIVVMEAIVLLAFHYGLDALIVGEVSEDFSQIRVACSRELTETFGETCWEQVRLIIRDKALSRVVHYDVLRRGVQYAQYLRGNYTLSPPGTKPIDREIWEAKEFLEPTHSLPKTE